MERDFKGIWIPKEIWLSEDLTMLEKIIFAEINSLDNENHCVASNEYFATFCNCSESKVSKSIKKLKELELIEELSFDGRHRKLRVVQNATLGSKKCYPAYQKMLSNNIDKKIENKPDNNSKELLQVNTQEPEFNFGKKKKSKPNLYMQYISLIQAKTDDIQIRKLLEQWLQMLLEKYKDKQKLLYVNVFKHKLNMLDKFDEKDWEEIIKYNLQRGYEGFYPIRTQTINNEISRDGLPYGQSMTDEDWKQLKEITEERRKNGLRTEF